MRHRGHSTHHQDRHGEAGGDQEPNRDQRWDEREEAPLPFGGRLPSGAFLIAALLVLAFLVALLVTPRNS